MKRFLRLGCIGLALTCLSWSDSNRTLPEDYWIKIRVDPTVELFCTIHRLARTGVDDTQELPKYIEAIEQHFDSFRNHRAVILAKGLWETHRINISALSTLIVYLGPPPELVPRNSLNPLPTELDSRWTADVIPEFIEAAREFSRDTKFMDFFNQQRELFDRSVGNLYDSLDEENMITWFQAYFGYVPANYTVIVGMQTGVGNYGASITRSDGSNEFFSIIGAHSPFLWSEVPRFSRKWLIPTVVHEFCHPYINPLVEEHKSLLKESGEMVYLNHKAKLTQIGCLSWNGMMNEYIVQACVIRYLQSKKDNRAVARLIRWAEEQGFLGIHELADLLVEYEKNRDKYPNMGSFIPRIAVYFEQYADSGARSDVLGRLPYINPFFIKWFLLCATVIVIVNVVIRKRKKARARQSNEA